MAILCFYKGYAARHNHSPITPPIAPPLQGKDAGAVKKQERRYYTLFYIFMALGVLTKGPIGFIIPFCIVLTYLILKKDIQVLKETRPWVGGAIFAFIVFTWVYLASIYGGKEYAYQILFKQNVGRFASSFAHKRPFYYYFINFPVNFIPWSIFIPSIAIYLFSKEGRGKIQNILLPVIWVAVVFIFFSIVSGKRDIYVLPLYPAASLITAWFLNEFVEQFREKHFKKVGYYPCYILCAVSLVLSILLPTVVYKLYPQYTSSTIPFVPILLIGGLMMSRFTRHGRIIPFLFTIIFVIFFAFNIGTLKAIPILNQYKSAKEICDKADSVMKPGEKLAMYDFFRDPYLFYTRRNHIEVLSGIDELRRFLNSSERVFLFIQEKDFNKVSKSLEVPAFVLEKDSVGHRDILFVSNKDM